MTLAPLTLNGVSLRLDASGALWWPEHKLLVVADLHFEKGSAYAGRGSPLPPYDTAATLQRLQNLIRRLKPDRLIALGDSFHDPGAAGRLPTADAARLKNMAESVAWTWIAGNHDPAPPAGLGGEAASEVTIGSLVFRHEPEPGEARGEICGHLHPKAGIAVRQKSIRAPCFVTDGRRLVMPAFGAYTGGLDVGAPAIRGLFRRGFRVFLLGRDRLHAFGSDRLVRPRYAG